MIVSAPDGAVGRLTGTTTVPMKWPEQGLRLVSQDVSPGVTIGYKSYGTATQMVVNIPRVADGQEVHAILTMEITRHTILPPDETDLYVVPDAKSLPPDIKQFLSPSPLIESNHARIKAIAQQLGEGQTNAWPHVRAIYDWVRKKIQYQKNAPAHWLRGGHRQGPRRLQRIDFGVHRHLPGQRHSGPHGADPRALLSGILSSRRPGSGALVPGRGLRHGGLRRNLDAYADFAEGRRLSHFPARYRVAPATNEDRDIPTSALESHQPEPGARRRTTNHQIGLRTSGVTAEFRSMNF